MTRDEYRAHPAVNFSTLKHILKSPAHYQAALCEDRVETPDMKLGTLLHEEWLEGRSNYVVKPSGMSFATKEGKAWRETQTQPILTEDEGERLSNMLSALHSDETAKLALSRLPIRERAILFNYRGVECKALIDACGQVDGEWTILDLKKTQDASPRAWGRKCLDYGYCMQAAFYRAALAAADGLEYAPQFLWQVVEDGPAKIVTHYSLDETGAAHGQAEMDRAITLLIECCESNKWPGYGPFQSVIWPTYINQLTQ